MSVLNITKQTAAEVTEELSIAKDTETKIDAAREEFRPVATRGSVLYFLICDMPHVNCMYQTSLVQFLERFDISMARYQYSPRNDLSIDTKDISRKGNRVRSCQDALQGEFFQI